MSEKIKLGIYKHYKTGNLYKVIGVGKHSETLDDLVFYEALYPNEVSKLWARPLNMFEEEIITADGIKKKRFEFIK
jgi:hypothetical protein